MLWKERLRRNRGQCQDSRSREIKNDQRKKDHSKTNKTKKVPINQQSHPRSNSAYSSNWPSTCPALSFVLNSSLLYWLNHEDVLNRQDVPRESPWGGYARFRRRRRNYLVDVASVGVSGPFSAWGGLGWGTWRRARRYGLRTTNQEALLWKQCQWHVSWD